jgi:hypothetical protein
MSQVVRHKLLHSDSNEDEDEQHQKQEATCILVEERLNKFQVIRNPFLRLTISFLPAFLVFVLLADWLVGSGIISRDLFRLTGLSGAVVQFIVANLLFSCVSEALISIWSQKSIIVSANPKSTGDTFLVFLQKFERTLNNNFSILSGIVFIIVAILSTYPARIWSSTGRIPYDNVGQFFSIPAGGVIILELIIAYIFGLIFWRFLVISFFIIQLSRHFELLTQPGHLDKSGGLKSLGNLCLNGAFFILVPAIALSIWIIIPNQPDFAGYVLWSDIFRKWLLVLILISIITFFLPLYYIHLQMVTHKQKVLFDLSKISNRMSEIQSDLRENVNTLTVDEGTERLKRYEFLGKVYELNMKLPTWPFDWNIFIKFVAAEAVPVLSLIGVAEPLINIFSKLSQSLVNS